MRSHPRLVGRSTERSFSFTLSRLSLTVSRRHVSACLSAFTLALTQVAPALAHPLVEAGVEYSNEASFEEALSSFDAAWKGDGLSREDVLTLLAHRAMVHFALRAGTEVDRDLSLLAVLDRSYHFPAHVPPAMKERFEQLREHAASPRISVRAVFGANSAAIDAKVQELPELLLRSVRIAGRAIHDRSPSKRLENARVTGSTRERSAPELIEDVRFSGEPARGELPDVAPGNALASGRPASEWLAGTGLHLEIPTLGADAIEWYAEVIGPGGAVIVREGDASAPRRALRPPVSLAFEAPAPHAVQRPLRTDGRGSRAWRWWAIGGSTAAAVATAIAIALIRDPVADTQISAPVLR